MPGVYSIHSRVKSYSEIVYYPSQVYMALVLLSTMLTSALLSCEGRFTIRAFISWHGTVHTESGGLGPCQPISTRVKLLENRSSAFDTTTVHGACNYAKLDVLADLFVIEMCKHSTFVHQVLKIFDLFSPTEIVNCATAGSWNGHMVVFWNSVVVYDCRPSGIEAGISERKSNYYLECTGYMMAMLFIERKGADSLRTGGRVTGHAHYD